MLFKLLLAFTLIPVAEIYVFIKLGGSIGALNTVVIIILTAFAGAYLARMEGTRTLLQIRENLDRGVMPAEEMVDALIIFAAGVVLLTPGFITDAAGLLLLIPVTRRWFKKWLRKKLSGSLDRNHIDITFR
jgi:UPF0716 protein FxsA